MMTEWHEVYMTKNWVSLYRHSLEVVRETPCTIVTKYGRVSKKRANSRFFPTFDEAQKYAVAEVDERIAHLQDQKSVILAMKP